ncbi:hypothetical protein AA313_de0209420 [Arthrobotrys entomopaga]|nr:hypothetical protein AA313_de0209420 [Arthrobotrys entomopaga]
MPSDDGQAIEGPSTGSETADIHVHVNPEPERSADVPLVIVEKTSDDHTAHGSVPGSEAYEKRAMDAKPDILQEYEDTTLTNGHPNPKAELPTSAPSWSGLPAPGPSETDAGIPPLSSTAAVPETDGVVSEATNDDDEDGGDDGFDDFDDFGETVEGDGDFDDFGDFDDAQPAAAPTLTDASTFDDAPSKPLCTPPPLQPPNWKLSRIRRLFLVSLGVPVDLDEILPAGTKQKKLVLPSVSNLRKSSDTGRGDGDKATRSSSRRRKEKDAQAKLVDVPSARILCSTSDLKLRAFTVDELEEHVKKLEEVTKEASETLTYWLGRREAAMGDKEAFERVIENLVEFAKKKR